MQAPQARANRILDRLRTGDAKTAFQMWLSVPKNQRQEVRTLIGDLAWRRLHTRIDAHESQQAVRAEAQRQAAAAAAERAEQLALQQAAEKEQERQKLEGFRQELQALRERGEDVARAAAVSPWQQRKLDPALNSEERERCRALRRDGIHKKRAEPRPNRITRTAVLERGGWTLGLVQRILGEPDERKDVSGYKHPLCLYDEARVIDAEASDAFASAQETIAKRKASAAKAVATRRKNLLLAVSEMDVFVEKIGKVQQHAIDSYNENAAFTGKDSCADQHSDRDFLRRITVNFIRHELTSYDESLASVAGQTGVHEAVGLIRKKVFDAIAEAYPEYAGECRRQCHHRGETEQMRDAFSMRESIRQA